MKINSRVLNHKKDLPEKMLSSRKVCGELEESQVLPERGVTNTDEILELFTTSIFQLLRRTEFPGP
jgi:hypothetical protein